MSEKLILYLGLTTDDPVLWAFFDGTKLLRAGKAGAPDALSGLAQRAEQAHVTAVLSGEQVAMRTLAAPPKSASKFRAAAAYLLEDELSESLDQLHVATLSGDGIGRAFAVKKSIVEHWLTTLADVGIAPDAMTVDFSLLNGAEDEAQIIMEPKRLVVSAGASCFAAERPFAEPVVQDLVKNDETIDRVVAWGDVDLERPDFEDKPVEWRGASDPAAIMQLFADRLGHGDVLNFLHGEYRKKRDWRIGLGAWRRAAALAAACLLGYFALSVGEAVRSARIASAFEDRIAAVHQTAFPDRDDVDPVSHARSVLSARAPTPEFLRLSTNFSDSIDGQEDIQIDRIRFNADRGEYTVNLRFRDIDGLQVLKQDLSNAGVSAEETTGVRRSGDGYIGELRVRL